MERRVIRSCSSCTNLLLRSREGGVDEEIGDAEVGLDGWEAGGIWGETTPGGTVSWVECAWDELGVEDAVSLFSEVVKAAESKVDMSVARPSVGPAVDDDSVVTMQSVGCVLAVFCHDCVSHEFKGDGFGPRDVSPV